jgi:type IV pilus assembly protein PilB
MSTTTDHIVLPVELQQLITTEQAWYYNVVPKAVNDKQIEFYANGTSNNSELKEELEVIFGKKIVFENVASEVVQKTLSKYYRKNAGSIDGKQSKIYSNKSDDFLQSLIEEAKSLGSSDIHVEAFEEKCRVRIRIDGVLIERYILNKTEYPSLINKIKIKANLDIAEKRLPQDGRIFYSSGDMKFDIRVSILPTLHGEKIVLRLLSNDATGINIEQLGFSETDLKNYMAGIKKPNGILLISGPTGSGKTTTLYATLNILNSEKTNILTIEDPIEYTLEGINQVQLKENIGLTFASALRTFLRQDPDIIMLGEIRDAETAQMAIRAALTGHLVLSTIHTNSAWGTVSRLLDMGVAPFLLANTLNTTVAQRLVRLLCPECKTKEKFKKELLPKNFPITEEVKEHFVPHGCESCYYTGYKGRKAIYEVIPIDYEFANQIKDNNHNIDTLLKSRNIKGLIENAYALFRNGETSLEEVLKNY